MAEKISITEFVAWCVANIDPAELSALMTEYGYSDDSNESIVDALEYQNGFYQDFGVLLGEGLKAKYAELNLAIGGIRGVDDDLTIKDWKKIVKSTRINRATGDAAATTSSSKFDWNALVAGVLGTAATIASAALGKTTTTTTGSASDTSTSSGKSVALYIIIAVVVLAVIGILWLAVKK